MRAYGLLHKCGQLVSIDCITIQDKTHEHVLHLSFNEQDFDHKGFTESFRLKDEDSKQLGSEVNFEVGNNKDTYNFIRNGELSSVVLYPQDVENYKEFQAKLKYLDIYVGEHMLFLSTKILVLKFM